MMCNKLRSLSKIINNFLEIVAIMVSDFHNHTRCGDIMMERLDYSLYEVNDHAKLCNISVLYEDYEHFEYFKEWVNLSKLHDQERLEQAKMLLRKLLLDISNEDSVIMTATMYSNLLLLHRIMGTLDLHYNTIDRIMSILTDKQIIFLQNKYSD